MIFSKHLLSHFVDISHLDIEQMCMRLSSMGLEVESAYPLKMPQRLS